MVSHLISEWDAAQEHLLFIAGGSVGDMLRLKCQNIAGYYDAMAARYKLFKTMGGKLNG